jgi:hypothetical protein
MAANGETEIDLYGPFLAADQIAFAPTAVGPDSPKLKLADFSLQMSGAELVLPTDDERFVLSALLSRPGGSLSNRQIIYSDFRPDILYEDSKRAKVSNVITGLRKKLTLPNGEQVPIKKRQGLEVVVALPLDLIVERVDETEINPEGRTRAKEKRFTAFASTLDRESSALVARLRSTPSQEPELIMPQTTKAGIEAGMKDRGYSKWFRKSVTEDQ